MLKFALVFSMLFQLGAAIYAISLIRRTRYNISWILISLGLVLMAVRRLFDFSTLFQENQLFRNDEVNGWIGVLISVFMFVGVIFIRKIFNLQDHIEQLRQESEQNVLSAIIRTEDKERQAFARELHDGLGPVLSSIKMTLSAVNKESLTDFNRKIYDSAYHASDSSIVALKEIANSLSPHLLKNFGLKKAVETFAGQLFSPGKIAFGSEIAFHEDHLSEELKISCYRIVSELMNNSLKHADPTVVHLQIKESGRFLMMHYKDDGCG
ncbi:MAG TPA: histidine kinase, partial [Prolixibacteraceae bacterium]|nr:histidine kinase [Prolixibacteraceae bacterium]